MAKLRPVFCGNFEYDTRHYELERLFARYGSVERIDIKSGYAFVYFDDERDAEDAIRGLDNLPFGHSKRRLSVEWSRHGDRGGAQRPPVNVKPTKTLFVINFDPLRTRTRDIERHFEPYGNIQHVRIRRNFAFVQFKTQEEATKALDCTNRTKILDRVVSVEYALRDDDERDDRLDSPRRGGYGRRASPDYGGRSSPYHERRPSPMYTRRASPDYVGRPPRSPGYDRYGGPAYERERSPGYGRYRSRSPIRSRT